MVEGCIDEIVSLDDLVAALGHLERFGARVALSAAQLNASGAWAADGALTMSAWLRHHARLSGRDASRLLRDGRFLDAYDDVAEAALSGELSASQVTALRAVVSKPTRDLFDDHQAGVVEAITATVTATLFRTKGIRVIGRLLSDSGDGNPHTRSSQDRDGAHCGCRSDLKDARRSETSASGCSQAAK